MPNKAILFTDVANSTSLKTDATFGNDKSVRDRAYQQRVQQPHYQRVSHYVRAHRGLIITTIGDAFFAVFDNSIAALRAAVEIFRSLRIEPIFTVPGQQLELYAGLHFGEVEEIDRSSLGLQRDYQGTEVDKAARVQSCAGRGQILLSEAMHELLGDVRDIQTRLVGNYFLKGLGYARLWDAEWDGSGAARKTRISPIAPDFDLPPFVERLAGREQELQEISQLMLEHRAVCLQGLSGVGKTSILVYHALSQLRAGALVDHGFFYFDCGARDIRISAAADIILDHLARFLERVGGSDVIIATVASNERSLQDRANALATALNGIPCLIFFDNFQDALGPDLRLVSDSFATLITHLFPRDIGTSRVLLATYERWSPPDRCPVHLHLLPELSPEGANSLLAELGIKDDILRRNAREIVGGHPQALQWFARLAEDEGISSGEVIGQLASVKRDRYTHAEFHRRLSTQLLDRIRERLTPDAWRLLSAACIYRHPPTYAAICAAADIVDSTEVTARAARRTLLAYFLLKAETLEGTHRVHPLVREYAQGLIRDTAEHTILHSAAAKWWSSTILEVGEAAAGIERHFHLREAGRLQEATEIQMHLVEVLREAGKNARKQGLLEDALHFNKWFLAHGDDATLAHFYLGQTLRDLERFEEAEAHYRQALEQQPTNAMFISGFASYLGLQKRIEEAEKVLLEGIVLAGEDAMLHGHYASFLARQHRDTEAEAEYRRSVELDPADVYVRYGLGSFLWRVGRTAEAETEFRKGLALEPDQPWLSRGLATALIRRKAFDEAEAQLKSAIMTSPNNAILHTEMARLYVYQDKAKNAELHFRAGLSAAPDDPVLHNEFARWLAKTGKLEEAERHFREAISLAPHTPHPRNSFAMFLRNTFRYEEAEAQLRAGLAASPQNPELANALAGLLVKSGRHDEAMAAFEEALTRYEQSYSLNTAFGDFLRKSGFGARAEFHLRRAIAIDPVAPQAILILGMLLQKRGELAEAKHVYRSGLYPERSYVPIYDALGKLLCAQGDLREAERLFVEAIKLDPRNSRIRNDYAQRVLMREKRFAEAAQQVEAGLKSEPENPWLLSALKKLRSVGI